LKGDVKKEVEALKRAGDKNIFVFGSGGLSATLLEEGLYDEYRLCLVPVVLGAREAVVRAQAEPLANEVAGLPAARLRQRYSFATRPSRSSRTFLIGLAR